MKKLWVSLLLSPVFVLSGSWAHEIDQEASSYMEALEEEWNSLFAEQEMSAAEEELSTSDEGFQEEALAYEEGGDSDKVAVAKPNRIKPKLPLKERQRSLQSKSPSFEHRRSLENSRRSIGGRKGAPAKKNKEPSASHIQESRHNPNRTQVTQRKEAKVAPPEQIEAESGSLKEKGKEKQEAKSRANKRVAKTEQTAKTTPKISKPKSKRRLHHSGKRADSD